MNPLLFSSRHFEIILALDEHQHFGRAAEALGVSQPSLTRSLKTIETQLGAQLFDRQGMVAPTVFGRLVLERARRITGELSEMERELSLTKGLDLGELRISAGLFPSELVAQEAVGRLSAHSPRLIVHLLTKPWADVIADVAHRRCDIGLADISSIQDHGELATEALGREQFALFCRAGHPLAGQSAVDPGELIGYPLAGTFGPGTMPGVPINEDSIFSVRERSGRVRPRLVVGSFSGIKKVVANSDAVALTIPLMIEREIERRELVILPVTGLDLQLDFGFIWLRDRTLSPSAVAFMDIVRKIATERK